MCLWEFKCSETYDNFELGEKFTSGYSERDGKEKYIVVFKLGGPPTMVFYFFSQNTFWRRKFVKNISFSIILAYY